MKYFKREELDKLSQSEIRLELENFKTALEMSGTWNDSVMELLKKYVVLNTYFYKRFNCYIQSDVK